MIRNMIHTQWLIINNVEFDNEFYTLASELKLLVALQISNCSKIDPNSVAKLLGNYVYLSQLTISQCELQDEGMRCLLPKLKQCTHWQN